MSEFLLLLVPIIMFILLFLLIMTVNATTLFGSWSLIFAIPLLIFIAWCLIKLLLLFKKDRKFKV